MFIIFSVILVICQVLIFLCPLLYKSQPRADFLPIIALAVLWLNRYLFHGKKSVFSVILWIIFTFIGLLGLLSAIFTVFSYGDTEQKGAPVVFGKSDNPKVIAMVYHPGGSNLPRKVNAHIADRLSQNGFKVILYTANAGLQINPQEFVAIGLSSPIYGGAIRPPLANFINRTDLTGVKCFVGITGGGKATQSGEIAKVKKLIESKGGIFIGGRKFILSDIKQTSDIDAFIDSIKDHLGE
jgi:hypothetical protein